MTLGSRWVFQSYESFSSVSPSIVAASFIRLLVAHVVKSISHFHPISIGYGITS